MIKTIKNTFNRLGFDIIRFDNSIFKKTSNVEKPIYVEFLGAGGVGKTTLYNKARELQHSWVDKATFIRRLETENSGYLEPIDNTLFYQEVIKRQLEIKSNETSLLPSYRLADLNMHFQIVWYDFLINKNNNYNIVGSDEGLLHFYGNAIVNTYKEVEDVRTLRNSLNNRKVIYCYCSPEVVAKRFYNRDSKRNVIKDWYKKHGKKSFEDIIESKKGEMASKEPVLEVLEKYKVPVLRINTEHDLLDNAKKVIDFVNGK